MASDFLPKRESELLTWSTNFSLKITAAPTDYGLVAAQATAYAALHSTFSAAYLAANDPSTRTPSSIVAKDTAKDALIANARSLARIVQATPTVTDEQKSDLGLTVRDVGPSPINPPADAPGMDIVSAVVRTVKIRLHDSANPTRRGKPAGVAGASVFSYVGATPPAEIASWKFEGNTTRTVVDVEFAADVASGATVWLCAFWYNPRAQSGPACAPVSTNLPGGAVMAA
jgi:hypothetical protein